MCLCSLRQCYLDIRYFPLNPRFLSLNKIAQFHNQSVYTTKTREVSLDIYFTSFFEKVLNLLVYTDCSKYQILLTHQMSGIGIYFMNRFSAIDSVLCCDFDFRPQMFVRLMDVDFAIHHKIRSTQRPSLCLWIKATLTIENKKELWRRLWVFNCFQFDNCDAIRKMRTLRWGL